MEEAPMIIPGADHVGGPTKTYLGDGVYAEHDGFGIWLTAENGIEATDRIYLEPVVFASLMEWKARIEGKETP